MVLDDCVRIAFGMDCLGGAFVALTITALTIVYGYKTITSSRSQVHNRVRGKTPLRANTSSEDSVLKELSEIQTKLSEMHDILNCHTQQLHEVIDILDETDEDTAEEVIDETETVEL